MARWLSRIDLAAAAAAVVVNSMRLCLVPK